jgi:predicted O-methyltransferase YrrM
MPRMSEAPTLPTAEHYAYLAARTAGDDAFLRDLKRAAVEAGIPPIAVCPEQGSFMQILLRLRGARDVLEVGTLAGYSALWMARALPPGGKVTTVEYSPKHAEFARTWIARSDVADRIEVRLGAGQQVLPTLPSDSFDAVFLDADKAGYPAYLAESRRLLRPNGLVMVDNAFSFGELFAATPRDRETPAVRAFNDLIPKLDWLQAVIAPFGDGLWVGVKRTT